MCPGPTRGDCSVTVTEQLPSQNTKKKGVSGWARVNSKKVTKRFRGGGFGVGYLYARDSLEVRGREGHGAGIGRFRGGRNSRKRNLL